MKPSFSFWREYIFDGGRPFEQKAAAVFRHQFRHQPSYRRFCTELGLDTGEEIKPGTIPLIPIQVFRDADIRPDYLDKPEKVFRSSGTTGRRSTHPIADPALYEESCYRGFAQFYDPEEFTILAHLPGYTENPDSSLVAMLDSLIRRDPAGLSRFLPLDRPLNRDDLEPSVRQSRRIMLFGAAFGLLDMVEKNGPDRPNKMEQVRPDLVNQGKAKKVEAGGANKTEPAGAKMIEPGEANETEAAGANKMEAAETNKTEQAGANKTEQAGANKTEPAGAKKIEPGEAKLPAGSIVVETGGMKTYRREISREELHQKLASGFGLPPENIHSEYGMAEMCSQAWDTVEGRFQTPPWLRISIRDPENPLAELPPGEEGLIGVMDLANVHSISFFVTQDRGVAHPEGGFRVLGRWDHAELRGCNFLIE